MVPITYVGFSSLFDVSLERSSCVVIYSTYVTLGRKVFKIRFQLQTSVFLYFLEERSGKSNSMHRKRRKQNL